MLTTIPATAIPQRIARRCRRQKELPRSYGLIDTAKLYALPARRFIAGRQAQKRQPKYRSYNAREKNSDLAVHRETRSDRRLRADKGKLVHE